MENTKEKALTESPEENKEEPKAIVKNALHLFSTQMRQITDDIVEFNQKRQIIKEKIRNGARRTSGRIV